MRVLSYMNVKQSAKVKPQAKKRPLTFGDFMTGVYKTWGKEKASGIIQLALKLDVVEFQGGHRLEIA